MTSGSCRSAARIADAKLFASFAISRWLIRARSSRCRYSIGS